MEKKIKVIMDGGPEFSVEGYTEADVLVLDKRAKNLSNDWEDKKNESGSNKKFVELCILRYVLGWKGLTNGIWGTLIKLDLPEGVKVLWESEKDGKKNSTTSIPFNKKYLSFLAEYASPKFMDFFTHCQNAMKELGYDERLQELDDLKN